VRTEKRNREQRRPQSSSSVRFPSLSCAVSRAADIVHPVVTAHLPTRKLKKSRADDDDGSGVAMDCAGCAMHTGGGAPEFRGPAVLSKNFLAQIIGIRNSLSTQRRRQGKHTQQCRSFKTRVLFVKSL